MGHLGIAAARTVVTAEKPIPLEGFFRTVEARTSFFIEVPSVF
jgi:hypothetical protein